MKSKKLNYYEVKYRKILYENEKILMEKETITRDYENALILTDQLQGKLDFTEKVVHELRSNISEQEKNIEPYKWFIKELLQSKIEGVKS